MTKAQRTAAILLPSNPWLATLATVIYTAMMGAAGIFLGVVCFGDYGYSTFLVLPFLQGALLVLVYGYHERRSFSALMGVSLMALMMMLGVGVLIAFEGIFCLLMAAPLWWTCMLVGMAVAYPFHIGKWNKRLARGFDVIVMLAICALLPAIMGAERLVTNVPQMVEVTTTIDVDAPPEKVWPLAVACGQVQGDLAWMFRMGVAYPVATSIDGSGIGARRYCQLSTGPMVEHVTVWEPGRRIGFAVDQMPEVMKERSPYSIHPPHLHGYFVVHNGEMALVPLQDSNGHIRTRIVGRSWYTNQMAPAWYWNWWCDAVVHDVHQRVFDHIKRRAEGRSHGG